MGCCDVGGRFRWGVFALLSVSAVVFTTISTPAYFGILASKSEPGAFEGCASCIQDFGVEVLKSVNATDIIDKLQKIHERNEKRHPHHPPKHHHHHHHDKYDMDFDEDECITGKDLDDLKPDLAGLVVPSWKEECKDVCTPVMKVLPLATTAYGLFAFIGIVSGICAMIPLCMLCCHACKKDENVPPATWVQPYAPVASGSPIGTYMTEAQETTPAEAGDSAKLPLLQKA